jgi:hypothetical protein
VVLTAVSEAFRDAITSKFSLSGEITRWVVIGVGLLVLAAVLLGFQGLVMVKLRGSSRRTGVVLAGVGGVFAVVQGVGAVAELVLSERGTSAGFLVLPILAIAIGGVDLAAAVAGQLPAERRKDRA